MLDHKLNLIGPEAYAIASARRLKGPFDGLPLEALSPSQARMLQVDCRDVFEISRQATVISQTMLNHAPDSLEVQTNVTDWHITSLHLQEKIPSNTVVDLEDPEQFYKLVETKEWRRKR
jgi:hypothetical protein